LTPPAPRRLRPVVRAWPLAAAAAVVLAVGGLGWGVLMQRQVDDLRGQAANARAGATRTAQQLAAAQQEQQQLASWQEGMLLISTQADVERSDLAGTALAPSAAGTYVWSAHQAMGALLATGLPALPEGRAYRFWFIYEGTWEDAGTAHVDADGHAQLIVHRDELNEGAGKLRGFAVTIEPSSSTGERTGAMVLQSTNLN
jgi:endonuclease/exonuclease/phosphatase (EEP) superfamily protein YafD